MNEHLVAIIKLLAKFAVEDYIAEQRTAKIERLVKKNSKMTEVVKVPGELENQVK